MLPVCTGADPKTVSVPAGTDRRFGSRFWCGVVVSWSRRFAEPIVLRDGARLATLGDAIAYLANIIPEAKRGLPEVQTASRLLTNAAERPGRFRAYRFASGDQSPRR